MNAMKNSTAHQLNLGGRFHASGFTLDALRTRVECLNKAIAEDPNYALGYVELADAYYHASGLCLRPAESLIQGSP